VTPAQLVEKLRTDQNYRGVEFRVVVSGFLEDGKIVIHSGIIYCSASDYSEVARLILPTDPVPG
jgi:hypothetical protein